MGRLNNGSKQLPNEFDVEKYDYDAQGNITKYTNFVTGYRWKAEYDANSKQTYYENTNGYKRGTKT